MKRDRNNFWLFESDGDFNPTWLLVIVFALGLLFMALTAGYISIRVNSPWPAIAGLSAMIAALLALLISALPRDKAKILAKADVVAKAAAAVASAGAGIPDTPADHETMVDRDD